MLLCPFQQRLSKERVRIWYRIVRKKIWLLLVLEYPQHSHFQSFATEDYFLKRERVSPEITKFQDIVLIHELATMISC